jgi:hypothetical protein
LFRAKAICLIAFFSALKSGINIAFKQRKLQIPNSGSTPELNPPKPHQPDISYNKKVTLRLGATHIGTKKAANRLMLAAFLLLHFQVLKQ